MGSWRSTLWRGAQIERPMEDSTQSALYQYLLLRLLGLSDLQLDLRLGRDTQCADGCLNAGDAALPRAQRAHLTPGLVSYNPSAKPVAMALHRQIMY